MLRHLLIALLFFAPTATAQTLDGAEPPIDCWTTLDGSPSGSRRTSTRPLRRAGEVAWVAQLDGEIIGEPLVWHDLIVVEEKLSAEKRRLTVLNLSDGSQRAKSKPIETTETLAPSIWGKTVYARTEPTKIQSWSIGKRSLFKKWSATTDGPMGRPQVLGRDVYVRVGRRIVCFEYGNKKPVWASNPGYLGMPAVVGNRIFTVFHEVNLTHSIGVAVLDRRSGRRITASDMDTFGPVTVTDDVRVRVGDSEIIVHTGVEVRPGLRDISFEWNPLDDSFGHVTPGPASPCAIHRGRSLGFSKTPEGERSLIESLSDGSYRILASSSAHARYMADDVAPLIVDDVAYLGPAGVQLDREHYQVLWRLDDGISRLVPARETLLGVRGKSDLVAIRPPLGQAVSFTETMEGEFEGRVALTDGTIRQGRARMQKNSVEFHKRKDKWDAYALADVNFLETVEGHVVHWPSRLRASRGMDVIRDDEVAARHIKACKKAARSKNATIIERYLRAARAGGVDEEELASTIKARQSALKKKRTPKLKKSIKADLDALDEDIKKRPRELMESRVRALTASTPPTVRFALLRRLAALDAGNAVARKAVRDSIPEAIRPEGGFDAGRWIDLVEAIGQTSIEIVLPPSLDKKETTWSERELGSAQHTWRKDLVGVKSERLYIITPRDNPSAVARTLSLGELVCDALEEIFGGGEVRRDERFPLKLFLYGTRDEYIKECAKRGFDASATLGNFSPMENLSRMYIPEKDDPLNSMVGTYIHELTHHWTAERCPMFSTLASSFSDPTHRGYWVVEGFAVMTQEFAFDPAERTWTSDEPRADSIDMVANARTAQLFPWKILFKINQIGLNAFISKTPSDNLRVPMTWSLGLQRHMTWTNVFYAQSAATCHYLYNDSEMRPKLLEYTRLYFTGKTKGLSVEKVFGISPDELGRRVVAYCKARAAAN